MFKNLSENQRAVLFGSAFSKKRKTPKELSGGGPSYEDQLSALALRTDWIVLNTHLLNLPILKSNEELCKNTNAFKHALQTYGPISEKLKDFRLNKGKASASVYHGHVSGNGGTYILEWTVIDEKNRIMALIGFGAHENYDFFQKPLTDEQQEKILLNPKNDKIFKNSQEKRTASEKKLDKICSIRFRQ